MLHHARYKSGYNLNIFKDSFIEEQINNFSIGLIIIEKDPINQKYKIKLMNTYAYEILELKKTYDFTKLKDQMQEFKKWENNSLQDLNLYNFIFSSHITKDICGTFISSISMIYVKIKYFKNEIFISIDNYNDERKELQGNLLKILKYQYLVTLYHELNNPLNALLNISEENNQELTENNEITLENFQSKLLQINLLVNLIKTFIKNFIWYFTVIFEISNNEKISFNSKINLEYLFSKTLRHFNILFDYKEISHDINFSFLNDKFITTNEVHLKNFIKGIFNYIYRNIQKKNGFSISYKITKDNKVKMNFVKKKDLLKKIQKSESFKRRSKIIDDILFNYNKDFNFSNSVQTNEMTKEFLIKLSDLLKIDIKIYNDDDDNIITLILPFSKEIIEKEDSLEEFTSEQKNNVLDGINRQILICEKLQSLVFDKNIHYNNNNDDLIDSSTSILQNSIKTLKNNSINNYNYNNINKNSSHKNNKSNNKIRIKPFPEPNDIIKLEKDPFVKVANEKNPFSNQIIHTKYESEDIRPFLIYYASKHKKNFSTQDISRFKYNLNEFELGRPNSKSNFEKKNENQINEYSLKKVINKTPTIENNNIQIINSDIKNIVNNINNDINNISNIDESNFDKFTFKRKDSKITHKKNLSSLDNPKITLCNCNDILICDDENFNIITIKNMLKKFNLNADSSSNGQECLDIIINKNKINCACNKKYYKLLFLDMMMPIMNGLEAAKKIQEMINNKEINSNFKIIIVSAHIEENLIKSLKDIQCIVEEVPKPLKKSKMEEILNAYYFTDN